MEISNSFKMSLLHKTNGLPLQQTLALIKVIKMDPYNEETKNNISNALQMEAHLIYNISKKPPKIITSGMYVQMGFLHSNKEK